MTEAYKIVDIPTSLTPLSFQKLVFLPPEGPDEPRNPPEPKRKGYEYPQAQDLRNLHEQYGAQLENSLAQAAAGHIQEWCKPRKKRHKEPEDEDIRHWQEMFKVMRTFRTGADDTEITLSNGM
jgi:hypothetical protein